MTDEDGARVVDPRHPRIGIGQRQFQMLRRDAIGDVHRFVHVAHLDEGTAVGQRGLNDRTTRHGRQQLVDTGLHALDEGGIGADQDGLRQFVVFSLREEVHRHPVRIARAIGDNKDFRRTGHHVDTDDAEYPALGCGDIGVAGADDLVHLRHGLRTVGQRADRLGTAHGEYAVDAGQAGSGQHQLVVLATWRRDDHDQLLDTSHLGRNRVHQHRRRIGGLTARHVEADTVERGDHLAEHGAIGLGVGPAFHLLPLVVGPDTAGSGLQCATPVSRQAVQSLLHFGFGQLQVSHRGGRQAVELVGVVHNSGIATLLHVGQDVGNSTFDTLIRCRLEGKQRIHFCREIGVDR